MSDTNIIHITLESMPTGRVIVHASIADPRPGARLASPAHSLAIDLLTWLNRQPGTAGTIYDPGHLFAHHSPEAAQALELVHSLLKPEEFGYSVSPEVRNAARRVLGIKGREGLAA